MAKNILDDEVLKANQRFIKNNNKEQTPIEATEENNKTEFGVLYEKENNKAIEDPKRNIEIGVDTAKNRTPSLLSANPITEEFKIEGFEVTGEGKWRKLSSPNSAKIDDEIDFGFENREGLEYTKEVTREDLTSERNNIVIAKLQDDEGNLIDPSEAIEGEEYTPVLIDRRDKQEITKTGENYNFPFLGEYVASPDNTLFPNIENDNNFKITQALISDFDARGMSGYIVKLQDNEGNLIDPDDAKEEEEYTQVLVRRRDKQEIVSSDERLNEFEYDQRYENDFWNGNLLGEGRAKEPGDIGQRTVGTGSLEQRNVGGNTLGMNDARMRELSIFLFMLFPYIGTSTVQNIRGVVSDPDIVGLATSASQNAFYLLQNIRYYTPFELAKYFLHNFYTLHFLKEMTIKYPPGRSPSGAPDARMWDGRPDIFFGKESSALFYLKQLQNLPGLFRKPPEELGDGSQFLTQYKDGGDETGENNEAATLLPEGSATPLSPKIVISYNSIYNKRKTSPTDILGDSNRPEVERTRFSVSVPNLKMRNGKWLIERFTDDKREEFDYNIFADKEMSEEERDYILNRDVYEVRYFSPEKNNGKWNSNENISEQDLENINSSDVVNRTNTETENEYILNNNVLSINLAEWKYLGEPPTGAGNPEEAGETIKEAIERRNKERNEIDSLQIGSILVAPVVDDSFEDTLPRFHIPFQFNPEISEGGLAANYEATSVLARIGELQSYSNTGTFTITLDTEYIATSHAEENEVGTDGNNWMNYYTLERIQAIEKAYRSLVLPHYPDETSIDQGFQYVKPPLLRVIIGGANDEPGDGPYANILTYGTNEMVDGRLDTSQAVFNSTHARIRSFIATNVTITKDLIESPIILDNKGRIKDTIKFKVSLSLTEVAANYMDSMPDYKRYSDEYINKAPDFLVLR